MYFHDPQKFSKNVASLIVDFIKKTEVKNGNETGQRLLKKKVDALKIQIEKQLTDKELKQMFTGPTNLDGVDMTKLRKCMEINIFETLEEKFADLDSV